MSADSKDFEDQPESNPGPAATNPTAAARGRSLRQRKPRSEPAEPSKAAGSNSDLEAESGGDDDEEWEAIDADL